MKWGLQHVKVTLEEHESGETVVIEQSSDGRVTCERGSAGKRTEDAGKSARPRGPSRTAPPHEAHEKPKDERKHRRDDGPAPKVAAKPPADSEAGSRKQTGAKKARTRGRNAGRRGDRGPLHWEPVKDHEYDGFAADSRAGQFKVLISKGSLWALFYEAKPAHPKHLGCFSRNALDEAKKRAQDLHNSGWPESESGPITRTRIIRVCPAPPETDDEDVKEVREKTMPKAEKNPMPEKTPANDSKPPPAPEPSKARKSEADRDNELLTSFAKAVDTALDEDEDEDD